MKNKVYVVRAVDEISSLAIFEDDYKVAVDMLKKYKHYFNYITIISFESYYNAEILNLIIENRNESYLYEILNNELFNANDDYDYTVEKEWYKKNEV